MNVLPCTALSALLATALLAAPAFAAGGDPQQRETSLQPIRATMAHAPFRGYQASQLLALETNLTTPQVRMVERVTFRHASYAVRAQRNIGRQFAQALGEERYTAWASGRPIALYSPAVLHAANRMASNTHVGDAPISVMLVASNP